MDSPLDAYKENTKAQRIGPLVTIYISRGDSELTEEELSETLDCVFTNYSTFGGTTHQPGGAGCVYMIKLLTEIRSEELLGILGLIRDALKVSLVYEANGNAVLVN